MSALADVLSELAAKGLLARTTAIRVDAIQVDMLPAPKEKQESDAQRERAIEQHDEETLFGSA